MASNTINRIDGTYVTEDGRFTITWEMFEVPCMDAHPCRISDSAREAVRAALAKHGGRAYDVIRWERVVDDRGIGVDAEAVHAVAQGKKGYYCPGDADHAQFHWCVWDNEKDDYANGEGVNQFDTKKEAVQWMNETFYGVESESARRFREAMETV